MDILKSPKILLIPMFCYLIALLFPAYINQHGVYESSFGVLLIGWFSILEGYYYWLANPFFWIALMLWEKPKFAFVFSLLSLSFGSAFFFMDTLKIQSLLTIEPITLFFGYYFWLSSFFALSIISAVRIYTKQN